MLIFINIGSNKGDRRKNLSRAMRLVGRAYGDFEISHVMESEPWGFESANRFLNVAMVFRSDDAPLDILHRLQEIEREVAAQAIAENPRDRSKKDYHRKKDGSYADRYIDIDIMTIEGVRMETEELTLPHKHLRQRPFFMEPLQELLSQIPPSPSLQEDREEVGLDEAPN